MTAKLLFTGIWLLLSLPAMGLALPAQQPSLESVLQRVRAEVRPGEAMNFLRNIYSTDRWFTFPKFEETAEYIRRTMAAIGMRRVELGGAPADGVSQFGYWTEPLAWNVKEAKLEIVDPPLPAPERVLADYSKVPCSVCMWSGSTPRDGITAQVVEVDSRSPEAVARLNLRGKLALTAEVPSNLKWGLVKAGALGAINTYTENAKFPDGRQWINAWGDDGWGFTKNSTPLLCFSITPRQTGLLRRLLAEHRTVRVHATVESVYYKGFYPYVTGVIPGRGSEEVLTLGHNAEQGAGDNATGVSAMLEAAAALNRLIASGRLPRPRRSIRVLTMPEMYGSMYYIMTHRERMRRTVAAITLDTPAGAYELAGTEYSMCVNPQVASSFTDALILKIAADYFPTIDLGIHDEYVRKFGRPWHPHRYETGDTYLGDPAIGVPDVSLLSDSGIETHHNSEDTPARVDPRSLRDMCVVDATYLYYIADAGPEQSLRLAELSQSRGYQMIIRAAAPYLDQIAAARTARQLGMIEGAADEKIAYSVGRANQAVESAKRLAPGSNTAQVAALIRELDQFGAAQSARMAQAARARARELGLSRPIRPLKPFNPELAVAARIVVRRKRPGTIPLDNLPPDEWDGYPSGVWDPVAFTSLYWCDGHRTLADVIRLTEMELGPTKFDFLGYFRFLKAHGYVEFVRGD